jgi:hypothetical protein
VSFLILIEDRGFSSFKKKSSRERREFSFSVFFFLTSPIPGKKNNNNDDGPRPVTGRQRSCKSGSDEDRDVRHQEWTSGEPLVVPLQRG